jgi:DnaA regulatory inactivator Hda
MEQQLLDLFDTNPTFENYITLGNEFVYNALTEQKHQYIHIIGNTLQGKTHLLKAWTHRMLSVTDKKAIYVDAKSVCSDDELRSLSHDYQFIAIDNIDMLANNNQIAMFDLFNSIKLNNLNNMLITSSNSSLEHNTELRDDLKTRILSGLTLHLKAPNDEDLLRILQSYITLDGINIAEPELIYLINHYTRNIGILINVIRKIVNTALLENRHITIPLIKQVIINL